MPANTFDLRAFNPLPRPGIAAALSKGTLDDLAEVFPYLFKPNRAAAWARDESARFPLKARNLRWMFRLPRTRPADPPILAVVGTDGRFSLWRYALIDAERPEYGGGLYPFQLIPDTGGEPADACGLDLNRLGVSAAPSDADTDRSAGFLYLKRALCATDREGGTTVRLLTQDGEHHITLELGGADPTIIRYGHQLRPDPEGDQDLGQVGGWDDGEAFYWNAGAGRDAGRLFRGSRSNPAKRHCYGLPDCRRGLPIRAAVCDGDRVAVGGDAGRLWTGSNQDAQLASTATRPPLRGYVRSLTMLPRGGGAPPYLLAGCDDHYLHLFDHKHQEHQKVALGGVPEAILPLDTADDFSWYELAVLVRDRGLICLRLLPDRFDPGAFSRPIQGADARAPQAPPVPDRADRDSFLDALGALVDRQVIKIPSLLRSKATLDQLLGLCLLLHRPAERCTAPELIDQDSLDGLHHQAIDYAIQTLKYLMERLVFTEPRGPLHDCYCYLRLLDHFAQGPYRTRVAVRRLEGWLIRVRAAFSGDQDLYDLVTKIIRRLPDGKRELRQSAEKAVQQGPEQAEETLGLIVSRIERLRSRGLFDSIILAPIKGGGRIDAAAIARDQGGFGLQVFSQRGKGLNSFRIQYNTTVIQPAETDRDWPRIDVVSGVRALEPLGTEGLLVVGEAQAGMLRLPRSSDTSGYRTLFDASREFNGLLCAAVRPTGHRYEVAIGAEWLPGAAGAVVLLDLDGAGDLLREMEWLPAPQAWTRRAGINALTWDGPDHLWGTTDGPGYLLEWTRDGSGRWQVLELLAIGSPQHTIRVTYNRRVLTGGEDGVLRAFDPAGQLQWARTLPGAVIMVRTRQAEDRDDQGFAPIAVITERDSIVLYDCDGRQRGMLDLAGQQLTALATSAVSTDEVQHHLIGTLTGEIRLVEEVARERRNDPLRLIFAQDSNSPSDPEQIEPPSQEERKSWRRLQQDVRDRVGILANDLDLCTRWCSAEAAMQEPLRACWAARCLLGAHRFEPVLALLRDCVLGQDPHAHEVHLVIFGSIGEHLGQMPRGLHNDFHKLCDNADDDALANLLLHVPPGERTLVLAERVLEAAKERVRRDQSLVSSAVLEYIDPRGKAIDSREKEARFRLLRDCLDLAFLKKVPGSPALNPGFVQGLMAILLRGIGYGQSGLLTPFAKRGGATDLNSASDLGDEGRYALLDLLEQHSAVLMRTLDHHAWQSFAAALRADPADLYDRLRAALDRAPRDAPDVEVLRHHLSLFPGAAAPTKTLVSIDSLSSVSLLTEEIRRQVHRVKTAGLRAAEGLGVLEDLFHRVTKVPAPSPLVAYVHRAWQIQWRYRISDEQKLINDMSQVERGWKPETPEAMRQVFRVMHSAGFRRGRYYRIHNLPCAESTAEPPCLGLLELQCWATEKAPDRNHSQPYPLTGTLAKRIGGYRRDTKPGADELLCALRYDAPNQADAAETYWHQLWDQRDPATIFELPVLCRREGSYRPEGLFVFDLPTDWNPPDSGSDDGARHLSASTHAALRAALDNVVRHIGTEHREADARVAERLERLRMEMLAGLGREEMLLALLRAAIEVAGAEDGLLLVQSIVNDRLDLHLMSTQSRNLFAGVSLDPEHSGRFPVVCVLRSGRPLVIPDFRDYPDAAEITEQLEVCFTAAGKPGGAQKWLADYRSVLALPLTIDGVAACAISLRHSKPYVFGADALRGTITLLEQYRWFYKALQANEERRHGVNALVHQLRADLGLLKQTLEALRRRPDQAPRLLDMAERQLSKLSDMSDNYLDMGRQSSDRRQTQTFSNPGAIVAEIHRHYTNTTSDFRPTFVIAPEDFSAPVWQVSLKGAQAGFERVLRNLIDNAVKYGYQDVRIAATMHGDHWRLGISNPGYMTPEEDALKFKPFVRPKRPRCDGTHVGLAASLGLVRAVGGGLELTNQEASNGGPRVVADLYWPLGRPPGNNT